MAGTQTQGDYVSDDGNTYTRKYPTWVWALFTNPTSASTTEVPKGMRCRKRFISINASGRRLSIPVWSAADALYTDPYDTAVSTHVGTYGSAGVACKLQGRTGERTKHL